MLKSAKEILLEMQQDSILKQMFLNLIKIESD